MTKWVRFEEEKRSLVDKGLSAADFEKAVRELCRKYRI